MDKKILFLGLDAAMPDLVKKFVAEGVMPNTAKLMNQGLFPAGDGFSTADRCSMDCYRQRRRFWNQRCSKPDGQASRRGSGPLAHLF